MKISNVINTLALYLKKFCTIFNLIGRKKLNFATLKIEFRDSTNDGVIKWYTYILY